MRHGRFGAHCALDTLKLLNQARYHAPVARHGKCLSWRFLLAWPIPMQPDRRFTNGPGPLTWLECAAGLPGRSVHVALALWHEAARSGSRCVALSNTLCLRFHVERNAKYRALRSLELAGLVAVERRRGRSPRVTLLSSEGTT
jgi:hypothetical protein